MAKTAMLLAILLACMAEEGGAGTPVTVTGGSWAVQDRTVENPLSNTNAQLGVNLTLDKGSVNQLVKDVVGDIVGDALAGTAAGLLSPIVDVLFTDILSTLGLGVIGIGGGDGGIGGAGGGGIALGAGSSGQIDAGGNFTGGTGTSLKTASLLPILDGVVDVTVGIAAGGGGGLTRGGGGYDLLGGDNDEDPDGLLSSGGGGGGLGITAGDIGYSASSISATGTAGTTFNVEDTGTLNIFGGSGGGGGLVSAEKILGLLEAAGINSLGIHVNVLTILDTAIQTLLPDTGISLENLLVPEDGAETMVAAVNQTGGTVNVIGGFGGGGGLLLDSTGAAGGGSTVGTATITGGTMNVYGGAGGGANITTAIAMDGGAGGGGAVDGGSMTGAGSVLNIYSGADGGDVSSLLSFVAGALDPLSDDGNGGAGGGGYVGNFTLSGGATLNLFAGTSAGADANVQAKYNNSGSAAGDTSLATAENIHNSGGIINLNGIAGSAGEGGTRLTGTYIQDHGDSVLNLAGGIYGVSGNGKRGGGLFSTGTVNAVGGSRTLTGAEFTGAGTVVTNASGSGNSLLLENADITGAVNLIVGNQVTLKNAENTVGTVTLERYGNLSGSYKQSGTGTLVLNGTVVQQTDALNAIGIEGGFVKSAAAGSKLVGITFNNTVTTSAVEVAGNGNNLTIENATVAGNLLLGANVTLTATTQTSGTVTLMEDGAVGTGYRLQTGGALAIGEADTYNTVLASFEDGGTIRSDVTGGIISGGTFSGTVDASAAGVDPVTTLNKSLTINNATLGTGNLKLGANVTLTGTDHSTGTVTLNGGSVGTDYALKGGILSLAVDATADATGARFESGDITTTAGTAGTLANATFSTGDVSATAGTGGATLAISNAKITGTGNLELGDNVTLTLAAGGLGEGAITLSGGGFGSAYVYAQSGSGTLHLKEDFDFDGADNSFSGGTINALASSELAGAKIGGTGFVTATAAAGQTLTLSDIAITGTGNLHVGKAGVPSSAEGSVVLEMGTTPHSAGTITLNANGSLSGTYVQSGAGTLTFAGGTYAVSGDSDGDSFADGGHFTGGVINSTVAGAVLSGAVFSNAVGTNAADAGTSENDLLISGAVLRSGANLTLGANVTLGSTAHSTGTVTLGSGGILGGGYSLGGGTLVLAAAGGNGTAAADFVTGTIQSSVTGGLLDGGEFTGIIETSAAGIDSATTLARSLTINNATFGAGGGLKLGVNVTLTGTVQDGGIVTLNGGSLGTGYTLAEGGTLELALETDTDVGGMRFGGGDINAAAGTDAVLKNAVFAGDVAVGGTGTGSSLKITGASIVSGGNLELGAYASLESYTHSAGEITLNGGGFGTSYKQGSGGTLHLNGNYDFAAEGVDNEFSGGTINALLSSREVAGVEIGAAGVVTATAGVGATLTLKDVDIAATGTLHVGSADPLAPTPGAAVLEMPVHSTGTVTLNANGSIGGTVYTLNGAGATLVLDGGSITATTVEFANGNVRSDMTGGALNGASFTGTVSTSASGDNSLIIGNATFDDADAKLDIGARVTLNGVTNLSQGQITLSAGGTLGGTYKQTADGVLVLAGGLSTGADITLAGGEVKTGVAPGSLAGAKITDSVTLTGGAGKLTLTGSAISGVGTAPGGIALGVGDNVALNGAAVETGASAVITLSGSGSLSGYEQKSAGATLVIAGDSVSTADLEFTAGAVRSDVEDGRLAGAEFLGSVSVTASGENDLTLTGSTIGGSAVLDIGTNVTLAGNTSIADGEIILSEGGKISGSYSQTENGELVLNGGTTTGATVTLGGGTVATMGGPRTLDSAVINGGVAFITTDGALTLANATLAAGGELTLSEDILLSANYTQTGGTLSLTGDLDLVAEGVTDSFKGGYINAEENAILNGANIAGSVTAIADTGKTLTLAGVGISSGNLNLGSNETGVGGGNVVLNMDAEHTAGSITLNASGSIASGFTQNGGSLILAGGGIDGAGSTFTSGSIASNMANGRIDGATFNGEVTTSASTGNKLTLGGAKIQGNAELDIGARVALDGVTSLTDGQLKLSQYGTLEGTYSQDADGVLVLAGGSTTGADITLSGGTVKTETAPGELVGAKIDGDVELKAGAGRLTLTGSTIDGDGIDLAVDVNVVLKDTANTKGTITLNTTDSLDGAYDQGAGGKLVLNADGVVGAGGADEITLSGGEVWSNTAGAELSVDLIDEDVLLETDGGSHYLTISGSLINNAAEVTASENVILKNTTVTDGIVILNNGSRITGEYTQSGADSKLILAGGGVDAAARVTISGGAVQSNVAGAELNNAYIAAGDIILTTDGSETSTLTMTKTTVSAGFDLTTVGKNVFLVDTILNGGTVTIKDETKLSGNYAMHDGTLTLAGGDTGGMDSAWLDGGIVKVEVADATLKKTTITKEVEFDIDAGLRLTIDTVLVDDGGVVVLEDGLTLKTTTLADGGKLTLGAGGVLEGAYTQTGGDLVLNDGNIGALGKVVLGGGTVTATKNFDLVDGDGAEITGDVRFSASTADSLDLSGAVITGEDANARLEFGSVMNNAKLSDGAITLDGGTLGGTYMQSGDGKLVLVSGSTAGVNGATFEGGSIESRMNATLTGVVIDGEVKTTATGVGKLTLSGTEIRDESVLNIGDNVTLLGGTANDGATITLTGTGKIDGAYTQSEGGALNLAGGSITGGATFSGGTVNADDAEAELDGAVFKGEVTMSATGDGRLDITGTTINDTGANLILRDGAVLSDSSLDDGRVTLEEGGALGADFVQNGGFLAIGTNTGSSAAGAKFVGGTIVSLTEGGELIDAEFTRDMTFTTEGDGSTLILSEADINVADGTVELNIGAGIVLNDSTLTRGTLSLDEYGALSGSYTQEAAGKLILNGGTTTGAQAIFNGGSIESVKTGSVLDDATFNATVGIDAADADLEITKAHITNGANLTLGKNVSLVNAELSAGIITLETGSTLSGEYLQHDGGTLNLAGGTTGSAKSTFHGGEIFALTDTAVLNDAHFTGEVDIDASAGLLKITNAHIMEDGILDLKDNVTLHGAELEQGQVILKTNSTLGGIYKQSGGILTMAGGNTGGVEGSVFSGGSVVSSVEGSIIKLAEIVTGKTVFGSVDDSTDPDADLTFVGTKINGGVLSLAAKAALEGGVVSGGGVTLEDGGALSGSYEQSGGELLLRGGNAAGAALKLGGGLVTAEVSAVLGSVEIITGTGVTLAGGDGATLRSNATTVTDGVLTVGAGGILGGVTAVADGGLILDGGAVSGGSYEQTGGTLLLRSDSFGADSAAIRGGDIFASVAGGAEMQKVSFLGDGITLAAAEGSGLNFVNARIDGGAVDAYESITMDVTIAKGGLRNLGGGITLNSIVADGAYTQESGSLTLADGVDTAGGSVTLRDGAVIAAGEGAARLHGANILAGGTVSAGEGGGSLHLSSLRIDGGRLGAGANVASLTDISVTNSGLLSVAHGSVLAGETTLETLGGIRFAGGAPGNRATVEDLRGNGGMFHFTVDFGTGETDYYIVEKSEGEHLVALSIAGDETDGSIDLLTDVSDGAVYDLADDGLQDAGAHLVRHELIPRKETDGSRVWSLDRTKVGLSSSAEGVGNAPAISLAQVTTGMDELGRHFRSVRGTERERQSWKEALANSENCDCVEPVAPDPLFSVWASSYTHHMAVDAFSEVSMNMHGMDIGFERRFDAFAGGALYAGFVIGGQWLSNLNIAQSYGADGSGSGKAFSAGAYGLWMNSRGWFAGAAARVFRTDMDLTSFGTDNRAIKYAPGRRALAASAEFGRRISFGRLDEWHVEPSVGLLGSRIGADSFMADGARAGYGATNSLQARAGVELGYTGERLSPYAEVSFIHGFDGRTAVRMAGEHLENDPSGTRVRAGLGASVKLTDRLTLSVDAAYERGASFRDVNGNFGMSYSW